MGMSKLVQAIETEKNTWEAYVSRVKQSMDTKQLDYDQAIKDSKTAENANYANRSWMAGAKEGALRAASIDETHLVVLRNQYINASQTLAVVTSKFNSLTHKYELLKEAHYARESALIASKRLEYWNGIVGTEEKTYQEASSRFNRANKTFTGETDLVSNMESEFGTIFNTLNTVESKSNATQKIDASDQNIVDHLIHHNEKSTKDTFGILLKENQEKSTVQKGSALYTAATSWNNATGNLDMTSVPVGNVNNSVLLNKTSIELLKMTKKARTDLSELEHSLTSQNERMQHMQSTLNATKTMSTELNSLHATMLARLEQDQLIEIRQLESFKSAKETLRDHLTTVAYWLKEDTTFATSETEARMEMKAANAAHQNATTNLMQAHQEMERVQAMSRLLADSETALTSAENALAIAYTHVTATKKALTRAMEDGEQAQNDVA